jgi:Spy/CpxP family protein refolding chaperone
MCLYETNNHSFIKERKMKTGFIATGIAVMAMVMFSAYAFADGGRGWGRHHMGGGYHMGQGYHMGPGYGDGDGGRYGRGSRGWGNLSEEDAQKLEKERESFFRDTEDLRQSIHQKRLEMRAEMAKEDADRSKLADLQKDLSNLQADFDQKRLNHRLEMKKLLPDNYRAGAGMGRGRGYGRGPGSGGGCW